ncbi:MAG: hypothetical protein R2856_39835 [Caldilineaceae bacterium]
MTRSALLAERYGQPHCRTYDIVADAHLRQQRWRAADRRGEVVFAIRQPNGKILLHTRAPNAKNASTTLPSGGIRPFEPVEDALLCVKSKRPARSSSVRRFVGLFNCRFHRRGDTAMFASYIASTWKATAELNATDTDEIAGYQFVAPEHLGHVALALRSLLGRAGVRAIGVRWRTIWYIGLTCAEVGDRDRGLG